MSASIYTGTATTVPRAGVASITVDGEAIDIASGLTYDATTVERETLKGQSGIQDFKETPKQGMISWVARISPRFSTAVLNQKRNATVVAILASGRVVSGTGMWTTKVEEVDTEEGTCKVTFEGRRVVES